MGNLRLDSNKAPTLPGLAHRYLCLTPVDPKSPILRLLIAWLTISEQDYPLGVANPKSPILARNSVLQDLKDGSGPVRSSCGSSEPVLP